MQNVMENKRDDIFRELHNLHTGRHNLVIAKNHSKNYSDRSMNNANFKVGDYVFLLTLL